MSVENEAAFSNPVKLTKVTPTNDLSTRPAISSDSMRKPSFKSEKINELSAEDTTCDYTFCAPKGCQKLADIRMVLVWLCWCTFVQSITTNGFVNSVITTLERRYRMTSTESGAIASLYDVGVAIVLVPLTYYGGNWRRLRILAWGMLVVGIGCFLFALPQATGGSYIYEAPISPKCYRNENVSYNMLCENSQEYLDNYKYLFWFAHLLVGVGAAPIYTLGTAFMDENSSAANSALFLGIFFTMTILGPGVGGIVAGSLLKIYVDPGLPHPGLTIENTSIWVGAWWICFLISGTMAIVAFFPLYGFPKELPKTAAIRTKRKSEVFGDREASASEISLTIKYFFRNTKLICTNPTFMFTCISGVLENALTAGLSTFGPKSFETLYRLSPDSAATLFGFILGPAGGLGMFAGGFVIRVFKMSMIGILRMQFICGLITLPMLVMFLLDCGETTPLGGIAGISTAYDNSTTLSSINLTSSCNADCQCLSDSTLFQPSCASNRVTYYSPCFAGCTTNSPSSGFGNCSCISSNATVVSNEFIKPGACTAVCGNVPIFLVVFGIFVFFVTFIAAPSITSVLRSVPEKQRTFALGIRWLIARIFGTIPGPLIFGVLIDSTCILWNEECGERGNCAFYSGPDIQRLMLISGFVLKTLSTLSLMVAWLAYKKPPEEEGKSEGNGRESEEKAQERNCYDNTAIEK